MEAEKTALGADDSIAIACGWHDDTNRPAKMENPIRTAPGIEFVHSANHDVDEQQAVCVVIPDRTLAELNVNARHDFD